MVKGDAVENEEIIEISNKITNYKVAIPVVKEYETIISSKKKGILNVAYRQGLLVIKFKESSRFVEMLQEIQVSKLTVYFKVKQLQVLDKYLKLKKSSSHYIPLRAI